MTDRRRDGRSKGNKRSDVRLGRPQLGRGTKGKRKGVRLGYVCFFFFQAEDGIRDYKVTGVQTCALPICAPNVVVFNSPSGDVTKSGAVRAAMARVDKANPGALTSSYFSTGSLAYVSADRHTTFEEVYLPGRAGVDKKSGAVKMRAVAANGLPAGTTVNVTGRDALDEANNNASSGNSSALLETAIGGLGALIIL